MTVFQCGVICTQVSTFLEIVMKNLQMVDFAANDKRSVSAMLRGNGDKRENVFLDFKGKHEALMSTEDLNTAFTKAARYGKVVNRNETINKIKKTLWLVFGVLVIVS